GNIWASPGPTVPVGSRLSRWTWTGDPGHAAEPGPGILGTDRSVTGARRPGPEVADPKRKGPHRTGNSVAPDGDRADRAYVRPELAATQGDGGDAGDAGLAHRRGPGPHHLGAAGHRGDRQRRRRGARDRPGCPHALGPARDPAEVRSDHDVGGRL